MVLDPSILFVIYSDSKDEILLMYWILFNQSLFNYKDRVQSKFDSENPENKGNFQIYSLTMLYELQEQGKKSKAIKNVIDTFETLKKESASSIFTF
ncbi:hypothetical protein EMA8858_02003 [Emticicia aquatica]|uniref:Uncharacterized protein n=1 Tax=Emticicia aquatica TaxID=1681835 RepID=A0ABM9AQ42_9BACT|nr:hypothetical protein [Emticicia aquatica]CAH0995875.1 hypothetical protein EMA8858_02003 [Emticicia aquatica]